MVSRNQYSYILHVHACKNIALEESYKYLLIRQEVNKRFIHLLYYNLIGQNVTTMIQVLHNIEHYYLLGRLLQIATIVTAYRFSSRLACILV